MNEIKTLDQIKKIRIPFIFKGIPLIEWFEVRKGTGFCSIRSGLNHADGETKSPYHYDLTLTGKECDRRSIEMFNEFYLKSQIQDPEMEGYCKLCKRITGPSHDWGCDRDKEELCAWHIKDKKV